MLDSAGPKRSLGQNFLINTNIVDRIMGVSAPGPDDVVLEIGPGRGTMTRALAARAGSVIAVEKDDALFSRLEDEFCTQKNVEFIHGDILEQDIQAITPEGAMVVANLPYNMATRIIDHFSTCVGWISALTLMVQKEVGERICARPGDRSYSGLSVVVAASFYARKGFVVGPKNFRPRPKVDSMVIRLDPRVGEMDPRDMDIFRMLVYTAFSQRRKKLSNSWGCLAHVLPDELKCMAQSAGIDLNKRPQELDWTMFYRMGLEYQRHLDKIKDQIPV